MTPGQGRATQIRYNANGDDAARWTLDGEGAAQVQLLSITYFDEERRSTGSISARLPAAQAILASNCRSEVGASSDELRCVRALGLDRA